jgi:hypothetical protein
MAKSFDYWPDDPPPEPVEYDPPTKAELIADSIIEGIISVIKFFFVYIIPIGTILFGLVCAGLGIYCAITGIRSRDFIIVLFGLPVFVVVFNIFDS